LQALLEQGQAEVLATKVEFSENEGIALGPGFVVLGQTLQQIG
jgi:hypothetical protein